LLKCCDVLLTENKEHFEQLPNHKGKVMTPEEFNQRMGYLSFDPNFGFIRKVKGIWI
jgi:hypothetical protein